MEMEEYPKLRIVHAIPLMVNGQEMIGLKDPHNLSGKGEMIVMTKEALSIISLFNGKNSITDIQTTLTRVSGGLLFPKEALMEMVQTLDQNLMLESKRYKDNIQEYRQLPIRKPLLAGKSYPENADECEEFLANILSLSSGKPGAKPVKAFLAPHIEISRGETCYAEAYNAISKSPDSMIYVVFGTCHNANLESGLIFTKKNFETPLGTISTNQEFIEKVAHKYSGDLFVEEYMHKEEFTIEFQSLFLQHTFASSKNITIVPILVGPFYTCFQKGVSPQTIPPIADILNILKDVAVEMGEERVCWIASADLSHVGLRFGDESAPNEEMLKKIRESDMEYLNSMINPDADISFKTLAAHKNQYNVCGLSSIYCMLRMIQNRLCKGNLLRYEQSPEEETGSVVTFGTMVFL